MHWAARNGHLEVVQWLHENRKEGCTINAMNWAAECGHFVEGNGI
jgi:ankyrin repeat protein